MVCRGIPNFLFLIQNKHFGYSLEPPLRGESTMYVLSEIIKNIKNVPMKFSNYSSEKNLCILHGCVFVM